MIDVVLMADAMTWMSVWQHGRGGCVMCDVSQCKALCGEVTSWQLVATSSDQWSADRPRACDKPPGGTVSYGWPPSHQPPHGPRADTHWWRQHLIYLNTWTVCGEGEVTERSWWVGRRVRGWQNATVPKITCYNKHVLIVNRPLASNISVDSTLLVWANVAKVNRFYDNKQQQLELDFKFFEGHV